MPIYCTNIVAVLHFALEVTAVMRAGVVQVLTATDCLVMLSSRSAVSQTLQVEHDYKVPLFESLIRRVRVTRKVHAAHPHLR
jgi:hypothetical protein